MRLTAMPLKAKRARAPTPCAAWRAARPRSRPTSWSTSTGTMMRWRGCKTPRALGFAGREFWAAVCRRRHRAGAGGVFALSSCRPRTAARNGSGARASSGCSGTVAASLSTLRSTRTSPTGRATTAYSVEDVAGLNGAVIIGHNIARPFTWTRSAGCSCARATRAATFRCSRSITRSGTAWTSSPSFFCDRRRRTSTLQPLVPLLLIAVPSALRCLRRRRVRRRPPPAGGDDDAADGGDPPAQGGGRRGGAGGRRRTERRRRRRSRPPAVWHHSRSRSRATRTASRRPGLPAAGARRFSRHIGGGGGARIAGPAEAPAAAAEARQKAPRRRSFRRRREELIAVTCRARAPAPGTVDEPEPSPPSTPAPEHPPAPARRRRKARGVPTRSRWAARRPWRCARACATPGSRRRRRAARAASAGCRPALDIEAAKAKKRADDALRRRRASASAPAPVVAVPVAAPAPAAPARRRRPGGARPGGGRPGGARSGRGLRRVDGGAPVARRTAPPTGLSVARHAHINDLGLASRNEAIARGSEVAATLARGHARRGGWRSTASCSSRTSCSAASSSCRARRSARRSGRGGRMGGGGEGRERGSVRACSTVWRANSKS